MTRQPPGDPFEEEIRRALADEAGGPTPDRLVARVAALSSQDLPGRSPMTRLRDWLGAGSPAGGRGPRLALGGGLVVLVLLVVGAFALAGAPVSGPGASPASPLLPSPSAAATTPTGSPAPSPTRATTSPAPGGSPVAVGFEPISVTFVSADLGWSLGGAPCASGTCAAIARTTDGGRTWAGIAAPATTIGPNESGATGVAGLRFADARDGWAFGAELWSTHDGGATWRRAAIPGLTAGFQVMALEAAGGVVHAAVFDGSDAVVRISTSAVGEDAWTVSPTTVPVGAGPVPAAQLVLHGKAGWLVMVNRVVVGGARLANGAWRTWRPPCFDANGPATLAAASALDLVAACDVGLWSTPTGVHLSASSDGGTTFAEAPGRVPVSNLQGVATPTAGTVVVSGGTPSGGSELVASFDGGATWAVVLSLSGAGSLADLGFTTAEQGVVMAYADAGSKLLMTRDGGRTWSAVLEKG